MRQQLRSGPTEKLFHFHIFCLPFFLLRRWLLRPFYDLLISPTESIFKTTPPVFFLYSRSSLRAGTYTLSQRSCAHPDRCWTARANIRKTNALPCRSSPFWNRRRRRLYHLVFYDASFKSAFFFSLSFANHIHHSNVSEIRQ